MIETTLLVHLWEGQSFMLARLVQIIGHAKMESLAWMKGRWD